LLGGCVIVAIKFTREPFVDAMGREAIAQTSIIGKKLHIKIRAELSDEELSVTLYHEILEAATVAIPSPPDNVMEFNEGDFERAAREMHKTLGEASPENLNRMLQIYGFRGK
jgi:hypothetical protein